MVGPLRKNFNFADQGDGPQSAARELLWMARKLNMPVYAQRGLGTGNLSTVLHMLWYQPSLLAPAAPVAALPSKDGRYDGVGVATLRSTWKTTNGFFTGLLAGPNEVGHAHLDNGMFVLDGLGQRWALDMGLDNYNLPGYFTGANQGSQRWKYYRLGTEGHNTLAISANTQAPLDFANQKFNSRDSLVAFQSSPARAFTVAKLTDSYRPIAGDARNVSRVQRGVMLFDSTQVLLQDEIQANASVEVIWMMHTQAQISGLAAGALGLPNGTTATRTLTLTQGGKQLKAEILAPAGAYFDVVTTDPGVAADPAYQQNRNTGVRKLLVRLPGSGKTPAGSSLTTIRVRFVPASSAAAAPPAVALANWSLTPQSTQAPARAEATLAVYPNPARTVLTVAGAAAGTSVRLNDMLGRTVRAATLGVGGPLDVRTLLPGTYVLVVLGADGQLRTGRVDKAAP